MAHLLGSKYCIESLRSDITDIQSAVIDVFSRCGPVRYPSWKYPDKVSCDLDMTELLETYDYSEDEEERQVSHIVLLEMVIDRLVLLIQGVTRFMDQLPGAGKASPQAGAHTSIGLVTRKYWSKMVQLSQSVQVLNTQRSVEECHEMSTQTEAETENKTQSLNIANLENTVSEMTETSEALRTGKMFSPSTSDLGSTSGFLIPPNDADIARAMGAVTSASNFSISRDGCNKASQTVETAFVPCESCDYVQKHLREVGETVVGVCGTQGLPSSLAKHRVQMEGIDWLSANDVGRWAVEQNKDLSRISKHMVQLQALSDSLHSEQQRTHDLMQRVQEVRGELKTERNTQSIQQRQFETKLSAQQKEGEEQANTERRRADQLLKTKAELEQQLGVMQTELRQREEMVGELERAQQQLQEEMCQNMTSNEAVSELETRITGLQDQLSDTNQQLDTAHHQLNMERAKTRSVSKHTESVQSKQDSLLERMASIAHENEELRVAADDLMEEKETLESALQQAQEESSELKQRLTEEQELLQAVTAQRGQLEGAVEEMRREVQQLERQVAAAREQEKLLIEYPDLNGPVNADFTGTGDVAHDMENQVQANSLRIQVLEEQNAKLRRSVTKMLQAQAARQQPTLSEGKPVALWNVESSAADQGHGAGRSVPVESSGSDSTLLESHTQPPRPTSKPPRSPPSTAQKSSSHTSGVTVGRGPRPRSRPSSAVSTTTANKHPTSANSSASAYAQLRKAGMIQPGRSRPASGKQVTARAEQPDYEARDVFTCPKCDKIYSSSTDLQLHGSYCYGP